MKVYANVFIGFIFGVLIMWLSPVVLLTEEPWDAEGGGFMIYLTALFASGFVGAKFNQKYFYMVAVGVYLGQIVFHMLFIGGGPLFFIGLVFIAIYSFSALFGSYLSSLLFR
ncbi:hypothetical protein [Thiolapillus sp.]